MYFRDPKRLLVDSKDRSPVTPERSIKMGWGEKSKPKTS